ncbi:MAG: hypothetical protein JWM53_1102, partial [bacterium]|nr:hypothetical protein [bacterium]
MNALVPALDRARTDWPIGATAVVAAAGATELESTLRRWVARGPVVLLTDDAELAPTVAGVTVIEPEASLDGGVAILHGDWGRDGARRLQRPCPQPIDGIPMSEAWWVNL